MQLTALMNSFSHKDHHTKEEAKKKDLLKTFFFEQDTKTKIKPVV